MDALHLSIALGPVALYFLVLGLINITPRPFMTTGARDWAVLGLAISGFVVAGPMELFFPENAAGTFGTFVWALLIALYGLAVLLLCLLSRPRLVIYNLTAEELRATMSKCLPVLDPDVHWAGDTLILPNLGVQSHLEPFTALKNVQIVASGPRQNYLGWRQFELHLARALREMRVAPNPYGVTQLIFAVAILIAVTFYIVNDQQAVAQSLREMLRW